MRTLVVVLLPVFLFISTPCHSAPGGAEKAAAESLYREANELARQGDFAAACPKYQTSHKLDPALGTMLRLADCWDRIGRTASAWAMFVEARTLAEKQGEVERMEIAEQRGEALESRLTRVVLSTTFELPDGYEIEIDGVVVSVEAWSTPLPVDPGMLVIVARAPGFEERKLTLDISESQEITEVDVPRLKRVPEPSADRPEPQFSSESPLEKKVRWQRPTGVVVTILGVGSLAAGGTLTYLAHSNYQASLEHCLQSDPNRCTGEGVERRNQALRNADFATIFLSAGGGLTALGLGLYLFGPRPNARAEESARVEHLSLEPVFGPTSAGLSLSGAIR